MKKINVWILWGGRFWNQPWGALGLLQWRFQMRHWVSPYSAWETIQRTGKIPKYFFIATLFGQDLIWPVCDMRDTRKPGCVIYELPQEIAWCGGAGESLSLYGWWSCVDSLFELLLSWSGLGVFFPPPWNNPMNLLYFDRHMCAFLDHVQSVDFDIRSVGGLHSSHWKKVRIGTVDGFAGIPNLFWDVDFNTVGHCGCNYHPN